jgi:hypothetical protein
MTISNFVRLADAKPIFLFEKFEMPEVNSVNKIKTVKPIMTTKMQINNPLVSASISTRAPNVGNFKFGRGAIATTIVVTSIGVILIATLIIIQTT